MKKMILYIGLVLFSQVTVGMDKPITTLQHKDQLYFVSEDKEWAFKVDFMKRPSQNYDNTVCEVRKTESEIAILTSIGRGSLSLLSNAHSQDKDAVIRAIKDQCKGFENQATMVAKALNFLYYDFKLDIDENEIENLTAQLSK